MFEKLLTQKLLSLLGVASIVALVAALGLTTYLTGQEVKLPIGATENCISFELNPAETSDYFFDYKSIYEFTGKVCNVNISGSDTQISAFIQSAYDTTYVASHSGGLTVQTITPGEGECKTANFKVNMQDVWTDPATQGTITKVKVYATSRNIGDWGCYADIVKTVAFGTAADTPTPTPISCTPGCTTEECEEPFTIYCSDNYHRCQCTGELKYYKYRYADCTETCNKDLCAVHDISNSGWQDTEEYADYADCNCTGTLGDACGGCPACGGTTTPTLTPVPNPNCGDVNCNGEVNMGDYTLLQNYVAYPGQYTICSEWAADVNCSGYVDMGDVTLLQNYVGYPNQYQLYCCGMPTPIPTPTPEATVIPTLTLTPTPIPDSCKTYGDDWVCWTAGFACPGETKAPPTQDGRCYVNGSSSNTCCNTACPTIAAPGNVGIQTAPPAGANAFLAFANAADINGDGKIDGADASALVSSWGKTKGETGYNSKADLNNDGKVNAVDASILVSNWSK